MTTGTTTATYLKVVTNDCRTRGSVRACLKLDEADELRRANDAPVGERDYDAEDQGHQVEQDERDHERQHEGVAAEQAGAALGRSGRGARGLPGRPQSDCCHYLSRMCETHRAAEPAAAVRALVRRRHRHGWRVRLGPGQEYPLELMSLCHLAQTVETGSLDKGGAFFYSKSAMSGPGIEATSAVLHPVGVGKPVPPLL